jgi:hypothetical protein
VRVRDSEARRILSIPLPRVEVTAAGISPLAIEVLSLSDVDAMRKRLELDPPEFAVATLEHQARLQPGDRTIRDLPAPTVLRFARTWAAHQSALAATSGRIASYRDFHSAADAHLAEWDRSLQGLGERLSATMRPIVPKWTLSPKIESELAKIRSLSSGLAQMMAQFESSVAHLSKVFRPSWPDAQAIADAFAEADEGKSHLDDHGYGFVVADWGIATLREIARERPQARELHRAFLELTRHDKWATDFLGRVENSPTLSRRHRILRAAHQAHLDRNYALSVPVLYAQLEGVLTDLLVLEGRARRKGHKVHKRSGGELTGLAKKAKHYSRGEAAAQAFVTREVLEDLSPDRNAVLHGSKTGYRQASRSARLLLMADVLTKLVVGLDKDP